MATYELVQYDAFGTTHLADWDAFLALEAVRTENNVGAATLTLPGSIDPLLIPIDGRLVISRRDGNGNLAVFGETVWLIRRRQQHRIGKGLNVTTLTLRDANVLLSRRIVAYAAGSTQAKKNGHADDVLKAIVRENFGTFATDTARRIDSLLSIAADLAAAPSISKSFSWRPVLAVLQEIVEASTKIGTYLAFDIVAPTVANLEFRTYTQQRGNDHRYPSSADPVVLGEGYGNLVNVEVTEDHMEVGSYVYIGGAGREDDRAIVTASDAALIGISPLGRIEQFGDARNTSNDAVQAEADALLRDTQPRLRFTGQVSDTPDTTFGMHYNFGDRVTVEHGATLYDCRIDKLHLRVSEGVDTLNVVLRHEN